MGSETLNSPRSSWVKQFSIFADNKVGRLNDIVGMLSAKEIHIMSLSAVDTTDSSILRIIVDYWEEAYKFFREHGFHFTLSDVLVAELNSEQDIRKVTCALVQAEINIHYTYPLLMRPNGKCGLVIRLEDNELATDVLNQSGVKTLTHRDLAR